MKTIPPFFSSSFMSVPNIFLLSPLKWCSILVRLFLIILYFVAVIHFIEYFYFLPVVLIVFGNTWKIIYFGSTKGNTFKCEKAQKGGENKAN